MQFTYFIRNTHLHPIVLVLMCVEIKRKGKRNHIVYTITYFFFLRRRYTISVPYYILICLHIYCYQNTRAYISKEVRCTFLFFMKMIWVTEPEFAEVLTYQAFQAGDRSSFLLLQGLFNVSFRLHWLVQP